MNSRKYKGDKLNRLRNIKLFVILSLGFVVLFSFVIGIAFVDGNSMDPTARSGHPVAFFRMQKSYSRGDIVAIKMPSGERMIKRIIAVEGDTVSFSEGRVYVNGYPEDASYSVGKTNLPDGEAEQYPLTIGENMVYVMGDNREVSVDSRSYGPIAVSQIKGKVFWIS